MIEGSRAKLLPIVVSSNYSPPAPDEYAPVAIPMVVRHLGQAAIPCLGAIRGARAPQLRPAASPNAPLHGIGKRFVDDATVRADMQDFAQVRAQLFPLRG